MKKITLLGLLTIGLMSCAPRLSAQNTTGKVSSGDAGGKGEVLMRSEGGGFHDVEKDIYRLTKSVRVTQRGEDFILYTDDLTYYRKTNQSAAKGGVRVESRESTIRGARMQANFNTKIVTFLDNVKLNSNGDGDGIQTADAPAKTDSSLRKKPIEVLCDRLDYNYENHQAIAVGNVRIKQEKSYGTCQRIVYDEDRKIARLLGKVNFTNGEGQTFTGDEVTVWVNADKIDAHGPIRLSGPPQDEKNDKAKPPKVAFPDQEPELPDEILKSLQDLTPLSGELPSDEKSPRGSTPATAKDRPKSKPAPKAEEAAPVANEKAATDEPATTTANN